MNSIVLAQAATGAGDGGIFGMLIPFLLIGGMFFFMFRSQKKEASKRQEMLEKIKVGDKVLTIGGIYGIVKKVEETSYTVEIADKVKVEVSKTGIATVVVEEEEGK